MKRYIKAIESIDTSDASFRVGTRWVDTSNGRKFTITKIRGDYIYTDGFNALLSSAEFIELLEKNIVRPTEDYFLVSDGDEFLGYLDRFESIADAMPTKYILYISEQRVYSYEGMPTQGIQKLKDDLTLYSTNYTYVNKRGIFELSDCNITYEEA